MTSPAVDPITRSVVQHRLSSIVTEMGEAMLRTSYSQILNSSRDFSLALCDVDARLIAQADHIPVHVGALPWATRAVEERFKEVVPGDVILMNDPYHGGSHLPDVTVFVPIFAGGKRLFWSIVRAHQSDIGGATHGAYNPDATEIWQEGIRIPPIKLYEAGRVRDDILDMLALNTRNAHDFRGDLAAMIGAAHLGERRMAKLFAEMGADVVEAAVEAVLDAAEQQARAVVATWKDGTFYGEAFLDDDGRDRKNIRISAKVTKRGSDIEVDLSDSDPQAQSFVNSSHANMHAAVVMAFAYLIDPDTPKNSGALRPLKVVAKQGTIVWADPGLPVTLCTSHPSNEIVEAVIKALAGSCPDRVMAGWGRRFRIAVKGENPRTGRGFIWHLFHARPGGGASPGGDGWSSIGEWHSVGGLKFGSIEVAEARFPLHFRRHEFLENSGGDGQYRGGLGVALDLVFETEKPALGNTAGEGTHHGSAGMLGGKDSKPHHYRLISQGKAPRELRTKETGIVIMPGDCLEVRSAGGGGFGPPEKRAPAARERDRLQGLVTDDVKGLSR
ncbi:hydantoinase B/oxoprolinase family protein [Bradyrhizobium manausense]|uniref:hydantoinase B/oxoprolinase family protein n=1 Tax=Bradyrhizobium TaxID=374 RepID=UPI001BAB1B5C|nr:MULTISPECIES: hydantoinase B/oxoprolinase family protein [Bradyrhizobium]MBR0825108.1 hydantoinase B/oxoprolinase family protein [Bradyrhizobium manausense]UVO32446.1 hydantoinase B/oxoprolinase family protein [Bradyrhizobium arachidis]